MQRQQMRTRWQTIQPPWQKDSSCLYRNAQEMSHGDALQPITTSLDRTRSIQSQEMHFVKKAKRERSAPATLTNSELCINLTRGPFAFLGICFYVGARRAQCWLLDHIHPIADAVGIPFRANFRATRRTASTPV